MSERSPTERYPIERYQYFANLLEPVLTHNMHELNKHFGYAEDMALTQTVCDQASDWLAQAYQNNGLPARKVHAHIPGSSEDTTHSYILAGSPEGSIIIDPTYTQFLVGNYQLPWIAKPTIVFSAAERLPEQRILVFNTAELHSTVEMMYQHTLGVYENHFEIIRRDNAETFAVEHNSFATPLPNKPQFTDMRDFFFELYAPSNRLEY